MRLIDADALKLCIPNTSADIFENCRNCKLLDDYTVIELIDNAPTIDAAPVVHGEWEWNDNGMDWGIGCWKFSNCHHKPEANWETARNINPNAWNGSHYYPNCGAKMNGGKE